jgi:hypothetical protein
MSCEQAHDLAPEIAIGIADGKERDSVLRHAATCPDCRQLISELSGVVDDLLLLAPTHEPPAGFAARTVARISPPPTRRQRATRLTSWRRGRATRPTARRVPAGRRWLPRLAIAASIVAALASGAGAVYQGTASDRQLADSYRALLAQGHGSFFAAAPLHGPTGTIGTVFGYQGRPSWLFATVRLPGASGQRFAIQLITRDGRRVPAGSAVLGGARDTWGSRIPMDLTQVAQLRFTSIGGQTTIVANLNTHGPWGHG